MQESCGDDERRNKRKLTGSADHGERERKGPVGRADAVGIRKTREEDDLMWTKFQQQKTLQV